MFGGFFLPEQNVTRGKMNYPNPLQQVLKQALLNVAEQIMPV